MIIRPIRLFSRLALFICGSAGNLLNPFWMLPLLGIVKLKARDTVEYGVLQLAIHVPVVFLLCWLFAQYLPTFRRLNRFVS